MGNGENDGSRLAPGQPAGAGQGPQSDHFQGPDHAESEQPDGTQADGAGQRAAARPPPAGEGPWQEIGTKLDRLGREVAECLAEARGRNRDFDELYRQLEMQREEYVFQVKKPMIMELISLYDRLVTLADHYRDQKRLRGSDVAEAMGTVVSELIEVLSKQEVVTTETVGAEVDYAFQRGVEQVSADRPELDNMVVKVLRKGFRRGRTTIRCEDIVVAKRSAGAPACGRQ